MKKSFNYFYIIIILIHVIGCKKDKKNEPAPIEISFLSAEFGTLHLFKADLSNTTLDTIYIQKKHCTQILSNDIENYSMTIVFEGRDTGLYVLGSNTKLNSITIANPSFSIWKSYLNSGMLHITKYDTLSKKMSGTFTGNLIHFDPPFDTLNIKNGAFNDLNFTE